ncbi:hypothetical protein [Acidiferrobacter thiooxydans]|uniref:hypothetical protein n=1 Tax=Acidiferrobacter thiooxydans TaxID=163359 RepID=UPI001B8668BB|nr:hypothetical protein [Acidiferrobacter thiooxydans]
MLLKINLLHTDSLTVNVRWDEVLERTVIAAMGNLRDAKQRVVFGNCGTQCNTTGNAFGANLGNQLIN